MRHYPPRQPRHPNGSRSPTRDTTAQGRMRRALLKRADHRCENCGSTEDLRACHIIPIRNGGDYSIDNGRLLCRTCDLASDKWAR